MRIAIGARLFELWGGTAAVQAQFLL
jgi:hypothetical protein